MDGDLTQEGKIPFDVPAINKRCHTYYKVFGHLNGSSPAVIVLHGGPGAGHEYLLPFAKLWQSHGLPVVFYDQIGCAQSTHLPATAEDTSFWQESLFVLELDNLIDHLRLRDGPGFHILGQSWGGQLAIAYAVAQPKGLGKLILANARASRDLSTRGVKLLRSQMPREIREALDDAESKGKFESAAYKDALAIYYKTHMCRMDSFPPEELLPCLTHLTEDRTVYTTMNGVSPLTATGPDWTVISRLPQVLVPTLVYNGEFDSSHDIGTAPFFERISDVRWRTFAGAGHMCHIEPESREKVLQTVGDFLTTNRG